MKTCENIYRFLVVGMTSSFLFVHPVSAQTPPTLSCQLYAGVTISGATGGVYAIQATSDLADSNSWRCVALVQLAGTNYIWADTSKSAATGQQFYRAVLTATNLAYILPGSFTMGSPTNEALRGTDEVQHIVTISKGFHIGKFPVTQGEYLNVVGSDPSYFNRNSITKPVESVTWGDATNYCAWRTAQEQSAGLIPTNWIYRLPTESEWEYAARAGSSMAFYGTNALHSGMANFVGTNEYDSAVGSIYNPSGVNLQATTAVGSYAANGWGLYDMAGNVREWCQDWYGGYPTGNVTDPQGASTGTLRVFRGGAFSDSASLCRSAKRGPYNPAAVRSYQGFRVVLAQAQQMGGP